MKRNGFVRGIITAEHNIGPPSTAEKGGTQDKGRHEIVDSGASWREFFRTSMPSIPDWAGSGATAGEKRTQGARSVNLKTSKKLLDEKGISLDL